MSVIPALERELLLAAQRRYRLQEHPQGRWLVGWRTISASLVTLAAAITAVAVVLSSGTSMAFAGWTRIPSRSTAAAVAIARAACGNVARSSVLQSDARGPFLAIVYTRANSPWQCVTEGHRVFLNQTTQYPPSAEIGPATGKVTLPLVSRTVRGAAKKQLSAVQKRDLTLTEKWVSFLDAGYTKPFLRQDAKYQAFLRQDAKYEVGIFDLETGPGSLTAVSGLIGRGVSGVTFVLRNGTKIQATVGNGWYLAWWPGSRNAGSPDPASITVTTATGTTRAPYSPRTMRGIYGPCLINECHGIGQPAIRAGFAPSLDRSFALFTNTNPIPVRDIAPIDLRSVRWFQGSVLGLDESQMREVSFGRTGSILVIPGREGVCIMRTFPPVIDLGGNAGPCNSLWSTLRQGVLNITNGSTLEGLVPNGNESVTAHWRSGRTVTVPVKDNTVLAAFAIAPRFVTYRDSAGKPTRWP